MTSRRRFLQSLAAVGLTAAGCSRGPRPDEAAAQPTPTPQPASTPVASKTLRGKVALVRHEGALDDGGDPSTEAVRAMLDRAMLSLTGAATAEEAWRQLFSANDRVAIKVNCLSGLPLASHAELALAVADGLQLAGVEAQHIIIFDRESRELEACGYTLEGRNGPFVFGTDVVGYEGEPTVVKSVGSCFSRIVTRECTAIVNIPVLKDHDLSGITGALKNHYGSVNNPNKLHLEHCHPYIADLGCAPAFKDKQRLVIYDALYACCEGGPAPGAENIVPYGAIMAATDPVASDAVALSLIEKMRAERDLPALMSLERAPHWLATAGDADHDLGEAELSQIALTEADLTG